MTSINFPLNPTQDQVYEFAGRSWMWNGRSWKSINTFVGYTGSQGIPGEFAALGYTGSQGAGFTGSAGAAGAAGAATLGELTDVDVALAEAGQVLGYTGSNWVATAGGGGGGGPSRSITSAPFGTAGVFVGGDGQLLIRGATEFWS